MALDERLLNYLKKQPELVPGKYDGSYELMHETINAYSELKTLDKLSYFDLDVILSMAVLTGTISIEVRKKRISNSSLPTEHQNALIEKIDKIVEKVKNDCYSHYKYINKVQIGMFGSGFKSFKNKNLSNEMIIRFIELCVKIIDMNDDEAMYKVVNECFKTEISGMQVATASAILHCLKPYVFPIINGNTDKNRIYDRLDIKLENKDNLVSYVSNCRKIKAFRDNPEYNFKFKNYRVIDLAGMIDFNSDKAKEEITMNATEHKSVPLNRIFYGPPGTGKTYNTVNCAVEICEPEFYKGNKSDYSIILKKYNELKETGRIEFITFHQSYGYEEFIEGIRPVLKESGGNIGYELHSGCFKNFCDKAKYENVPYVFIIDEINRGNISKIFGELITLIEDSKRIGNDEEMTVKLPYSGEKFGVPNNVYIIGTMNTADRSIALMDTALRRRFVFAEMMPDAEFLNGLMITADGKTLDVKKMFEDMNERIECLFDREHTIGHAYFANLKKAPSIGVLADIFRNRIIPLLQEYFFEDYEKLAIVLSRDENSCSFIEKKEFMNTEMYKFNDDALNNIESYLKIYEESSNEQSV